MVSVFSVRVRCCCSASEERVEVMARVGREYRADNGFYPVVCPRHGSLHSSRAIDTRKPLPCTGLSCGKALVMDGRGGKAWSNDRLRLHPASTCKKLFAAAKARYYYFHTQKYNLYTWNSPKRFDFKKSVEIVLLWNSDMINIGIDLKHTCNLVLNYLFPTFVLSVIFVCDARRGLVLLVIIVSGWSVSFGACATDLGLVDFNLSLPFSN